MVRPDDVLRFWLTEVGPGGWYVAVPAVDQTITRRFQTLWDEARAGALGPWHETPDGMLAYLILTDQFPRNMFRGKAEAFATDALARDAARRSVALGLDLQVTGPERVFFYMPFEHSEALADQDWAVALMRARLPDVCGADADDFLLHARAHRELIRRFGRFPFRNQALGRVATADEQTFLTTGGYGQLVRELG